jgi:hypothetical protein
MKLPRASRVTYVGAERIGSSTFEYETGILTTTPGVWSKERMN